MIPYTSVLYFGISLYSLLPDLVFAWFKSKYTASYLGYLLAMGLMGVWHGTAWHFILYGLYHGTLLVLTDWLERQNKKKKWWDKKRWTVRAVQVLVTFQLVCFGLLIFSGRLG